MRVLFADCYYPKSHKHFEEELFKNLAQVCDLFIASPPNWYESTPKSVYTILIPEQQVSVVRSLYLRLYHACKNLYKVKEIIDHEKIDVVILGEFENYLLPFYDILFPKKCPVVLMYHNNLDILERKDILHPFFNLMKDKAYHLVMEMIVANKLIKDYRVNDKQIIHWPHPFYSGSCIEYKHKLYDCVGLSQSNDDNIIKSIIAMENDCGNFKKRQLRVILRSKRYEYDNGYLKVMKGWLSEKDYRNYMHNTKCVFVAFPAGNVFFRTSGTMVDAFSNGACVIGVKNALIAYYASEYPRICKVFNSETFTNDIMALCRDYDSRTEEELRRCAYYHGSQYIQECMHKSLEVIVKRFGSYAGH